MTAPAAVAVSLGLLAGFSQAASAALSFQIGPQSSPASPDVWSGPVPARPFFDLIFTETEPTENEGFSSTTSR